MIPRPVSILFRRNGEFLHWDQFLWQAVRIEKEIGPCLVNFTIHLYWLNSPQVLVRVTLKPIQALPARWVWDTVNLSTDLESGTGPVYQARVPGEQKRILLQEFPRAHQTRAGVHHDLVILTPALEGAVDKHEFIRVRHRLADHWFVVVASDFVWGDHACPHTEITKPLTGFPLLGVCLDNGFQFGPDFLRLHGNFVKPV